MLLSIKNSLMVYQRFLHICNMFKKLREKWKVNGTKLFLILLTFAIGGSLCGIAGKKIMNFIGLEKGIAWIVVYIIVLSIIWPVCVLLISIPLGQLVFFKKYIAKIFSSFKGNKSKAAISNVQKATGNVLTNLAIFASGAGSNAEKIIEYFKNNATIKIALIVCNKPAAGVLQIAKENNINILLIEKQPFSSGGAYINELKKYNINWIILAGFLWKLPLKLIQAFPGRIINIHPALLPKYGGRGMYGGFVHEAVIAAGEKESGISIHFVDEIYDHGEVIMQARCEVIETDSAESLAQKIHSLEHRHYAEVIEQEILKAKK